MSRSHCRYLLEQGVGAAVVNFAINAAIAWAMFRGAPSVPLWGQQSIMADTLGTCFMLPFITCLVVTPMARRHVRAGRVPALGWTRASHPALSWLPRRTAARGAVLGLACVATFAPVAWVGLGHYGVADLSVGGFVLFKGSFAAATAALVTPAIALWGIAESSPEHGADRRSDSR
jgi:hypothetical protein